MRSVRVFTVRSNTLRSTAVSHWAARWRHENRLAQPIHVGRRAEIATPASVSERSTERGAGKSRYSSHAANALSVFFRLAVPDLHATSVLQAIQNRPLSLAREETWGVDSKAPPTVATLHPNLADEPARILGNRRAFVHQRERPTLSRAAPIHGASPIGSMIPASVRDRPHVPRLGSFDVARDPGTS